MKKRREPQVMRLAIVIGLVVASMALGAGECSAQEWRSLFNGRDFEGWDKYLAYEIGGEKPYGWNRDPKNVFTVTEVDGKPAIHVSGEIFGSLTTKEEFENFHLRLQFKWGERRWVPRARVARDTGILYCGVGKVHHSTGWLTAVENNIMEKGTGQWWGVNGSIIDTEGEWITKKNELFVPYKRESEAERNIVYRPGGPRITAKAGNGITPEIDVEEVFGNWNTVEVIFWAGNCIHILNEHVNLIATSPRYIESDKVIPMRRGKIQLQSEAAEAFFRNIEIREIDEVPAEYRARLPSLALDEQGFEDLLTSETVADWKQCGPGGFTFKDGVATSQGGMGLWWYSGREFKNFILRGDFRQSSETADSGVFLRFPDPGDDVHIPIKQGHEVEIGDPHPEKPTWRTGSVYPHQASVKANTKEPGEWNSLEITSVGHNYSVRINGRLVTTWTDPKHLALKGYIGLQNYADGHTVSYRNLRIKELP